MVTDEPFQAPTRLCCGQRHIGPVCPDGMVMCCMCFNRVHQDRLNVASNGQKEDVCSECAEGERNAKAQEAQVASAGPCPPFWYGVGAFFVVPVAAIFCALMGLLMILAWPFIPFLCYTQRKREICKPNTTIEARRDAATSNECSEDQIPD